jgi:hypothetical protein
MIGWAIVMNFFAALITFGLVSFGGATSTAITPALLEVVSIVVLVVALKRYGRSV